MSIEKTMKWQIDYQSRHFSKILEKSTTFNVSRNMRALFKHLKFIRFCDLCFFIWLVALFKYLGIRCYRLVSTFHCLVSLSFPLNIPQISIFAEHVMAYELLDSACLKRALNNIIFCFWDIIVKTNLYYSINIKWNFSVEKKVKEFHLYNLM